MLQLRDQNIPRLLEQLLVIPAGVEESEGGGQPVVFPHPDSVVESQPRLLVNSPVPGLEAVARPQLTLSSTALLQQRVCNDQV